MKGTNDPELFTLCDPTEAANFHVNEPMYIWTSRPSLRSRIVYSFRNRFPWFWPRSFVSAIDHEAGSITLSVERWSWRRWRWEAQS